MPDLRPGCATAKFREDTAPADALVDKFKVQCSLARRGTTEDVQGKSPPFTIFTV